jgi:hypothetical protein
MQDNGKLSAQDFDALDHQINISQPSQVSPSGPFGPGFLGSLGNAVVGAGNIIHNTAQGFGDAAGNTLGSALSALPGVNIPTSQTAQGTGYGLGKFAGNIAAFAGGGEVVDSLRALSEGVPLAGQAAQYLGQEGLIPGAARRAIGTGMYGALANPQDRLGNAGVGSLVSLGLEGVPYVGKALSSAATYLSPQKYGQGIIDSLGGSQDIMDPMQQESATKDVIQGVNQAYNARVQNSKNLYQNVKDQVTDPSIYPEVNRVYGIPSVAPTNTNVVTRQYTPVDYDAEEGIGAEPSPLKTTSIMASGVQNPASMLDGAYPKLSQNIMDSFSPDIKDLHDNFIANPTFQNAHNLQSELGSYSRQLQSPIMPPTPATIGNVKAINNARGALKADINNFLANKSPELAKEYSDAADDFMNNVVPYRTNPAIYKMATGETTNLQPSTLGNIFKAPDEDLQKVFGDLPEDTANKILYTKLGQTVPNKSAQGLMNSYKNLGQQGLGSYVTPAIKDSFNELNSRLMARNSAQLLAGLGGGAIAAHPLGAGAMAVGSAVGTGAAALANPFLNYFGPRLPINQISSSISNGLRGTYPQARAAVLANYLNNSSNGGQ